MSDDSLTTRVLLEIRDEARETRDEVRELRRDANARFDRVEVRIDQTNARLERVREDVKAEIKEVDLRVATRIVELIAANRDTNVMLSDVPDLRERLERCELEIDEIKKRLG